MTEHTSTLLVLVDDALKAQAEQILARQGLTMADAVGLLLYRIVADQALPFELKVPNADTRAALDESRAIMAARRPRFDSADELFADLEKNCRD